MITIISIRNDNRTKTFVCLYRMQRALCCLGAYRCVRLFPQVFFFWMKSASVLTCTWTQSNAFKILNLLSPELSIGNWIYSFALHYFECKRYCMLLKCMYNCVHLWVCFRYSWHDLKVTHKIWRWVYFRWKTVKSETIASARWNRNKIWTTKNHRRQLQPMSMCLA